MTNYMKSALQEASLAKGFQLPNPRVGAVIVKDNKVIGKGHHQKFGSYHAEVNAINDAIKNGEDTEGSTIYVTLQPCSKFGKTPPCSQAIIDSGIQKVVIASVDESDRSSIEELKRNNIEVEIESSDEANEVIQDFNWNVKSTKPFVVGKIAIRENGDTTANKKNNEWISSQSSINASRLKRSMYQSILVGAETIRVDNPFLTTREEGYKDPIIVVLTREFNLELDSNIFKTDSKKIIFTLSKDLPIIENVEFIQYKENLSTNTVLDELFSRNIKSILVEGGKKTLQNFIDEGNINVLDLYIPTTNQDFNPKTIEWLKLNNAKLRKRNSIGTDTYYEYLIKE